MDPRVLHPISIAFLPSSLNENAIFEPQSTRYFQPERDDTLSSLYCLALRRPHAQELASPGALEGTKWPAVYRNRYPKSWWYHQKLCFKRKLTLTLRDKTYIQSQIISSLGMGEDGQNNAFGSLRSLRCLEALRNDYFWAGFSVLFLFSFFAEEHRPDHEPAHQKRQNKRGRKGAGY